MWPAVKARKVVLAAAAAVVVASGDLTACAANDKPADTKSPAASASGAATPTPDFNSDDPGYDLILLAGQSNMQGSGLPLDPVLDAADPRDWQYAE